MTPSEREKAIEWFEDTLEVSDYEGIKHDKSALLALKAYRTTSEIEKIIAENMPIEFIQVIEPFARARIYRKVAKALTKERTER